MHVFLNDNKKSKDTFPISVQLGNGCGVQVFTVDAAKELSKKLAELVEEKFTSTNTGSSKIYSDEACEYCINHNKSCRGKWCSGFMGRKLQASA